MACRAIVVFFSIIVIGSIALPASVLKISTSTDSITVGETGTIAIACSPSEPIVSYECEIVFDPSVIQITAINQGDFFDTFDTYNSPNISINNTAGSIQYLYALILGPQGNVTENGTVATINFTAADTIGSTAIELQNAGVTNWTAYLPITVKDTLLTVHNTTYPRWDITQDGRTDAADVSTLIAHYGQESTDPENDLWDIVINGRCDGQDISMIVAKYGE